MVKRETTLTFYGGVNEIGGNKILLKNGDTKVFFDFGMSFALKRQYYSPPFLSPKSEAYWSWGFFQRLKSFIVLTKRLQMSTVFISHGHMDHSAYLSFIKREIPVYWGETTKIILQAFGEMRRTDLEFNVESIAFKPFRTGATIRVGGLEIEPVHVDHSVPGAYGFIVHTSDGAVVYTGDFRFHGAKPEMTWEFVEKAKEAEPVAVITEATNMTGATASSKGEVETKLDSIVRQADGLVLAEFASTDVDKLNSFYRAAKNNKRCLVVSLRQAYLMNALRKDKGLAIPSLSDENLLIFENRRKHQTRKR